MSLTVVFINLFQHYYYLIKNGSITKLLASNILSNNPVNRILIMSIFHKMKYNKDYLINPTPKFSGYKLVQNIVDKYTFAIFNDGIIMIDFDSKTISLNEIKESLDEHPYSYSIVKSAGGYHVFITNSFFDLKSIKALEIMTSFKGADLLFSFFTFMNGSTNIRMCRKENEPSSGPTYKFVENYTSLEGKRNNVVPRTTIQKIVMNHISEAENYRNIIVKEKENFRGILVAKKYTELETIEGSILDPRLKFAEIEYPISLDLQKKIDTGMGINGIFNYIKTESLKKPIGLPFHYVPLHFYK
jgi:hypothetical protein